MEPLVRAFVGERLVVLEQVGDVGGEPPGLDQRRVQLVAALVERGEGDVEVAGPGHEVRCDPVELLGEQGEVAEELADLGVVAGLEPGEDRRVDDGSVDVLAQAVAGVGQLVEDDGQLGRIDGLQDRVGVGQDLLELEAAERVGDLAAVGEERTRESRCRPGSMSTNFSPKSVLGRMTAWASAGTRVPSLMRRVITARLSTSSIRLTSPTLTPRILTSLPDSRPWPAAAKLPWSS